MKKTTSTNPTPLTVSEEVKISKLEISFPNEDMNKVVEKINQLIDYINDSI